MTKAPLVAALIMVCFAVSGVAYASSGASFSGDRTLITKFRLDDGSSGGPGYRRARWTSTTPVLATLAVRNNAGRLVETVVGGNQYSTTAALAWISPGGMFTVNRSFPPAGFYKMTLTITAYAHGSISQMSTDTVVAKWSARIPDHTKLCVPRKSGDALIGCG